MTPTQHRFTQFIAHREMARLHKEQTGKRGGSLDRLIQQYKFCNINREHDAVTVWIDKNVRTKLHNASLSLAVLNLAVCRVFNEPNILRNLCPIVNRDAWRLTVGMVNNLHELGEKMFRGAYLIVSHGRIGKGVPTHTCYLGALTDVWLTDFDHCESMAELAAEIASIVGFADFLTNQILTDLRYMPQSASFEDRNTFVLCGPGTCRGINRWNGATGKDVDKSVQAAYGTQFLLNLREDLEFLSHLDAEVIQHFQDPNNLANSFCEWDKHERALDVIETGKKPHLKKA